jgi:hypothetical protein
MPNLAYYDAISELGAQKPEQGQLVELEHPMLQGCKLLSPFNENAGAYVYNAITGSRGTITGAPAWSPPGGLTFAGNACNVASTSFINITPYPFHPDVTPHTFLFDLQLGTFAGLYNELFYDGAWSVQIGTVGLEGDRCVGVGNYGSGTYRETNAIAGLVAGRCRIAITHDGGNTSNNIHVYTSNGVDPFIEATYATTANNMGVSTKTIQCL